MLHVQITCVDKAATLLVKCLVMGKLLCAGSLGLRSLFTPRKGKRTGLRCRFLNGKVQTSKQMWNTIRASWQLPFLPIWAFQVASINNANQQKSNIFSPDWTDTEMQNCSTNIWKRPCQWEVGIGGKGPIWLGDCPRLAWSNLPTCKADGTLEGASHPFKAVLDQVALEFGRGVKGLAAEFAFVVQSFIC